MAHSDSDSGITSAFQREDLTFTLLKAATVPKTNSKLFIILSKLHNTRIFLVKTVKIMNSKAWIIVIQSALFFSYTSSHYSLSKIWYDMRKRSEWAPPVYDTTPKRFRIVSELCGAGFFKQEFEDNGLSNLELRKPWLVSISTNIHKMEKAF